jgi:hypothetical protein
MTTALGVRVCGVTGCHRKTHVTETGIHYSRCIGCTLALLSGVFADPRSGERGVPPVPRSSLPASSVRRPAV